MLDESVTVSAAVVGIGMRTFFSIQHIKSAVLFANFAVDEQKRMVAESDYANKSKLHAFVCASIFFSAAFLEATANELFAESQDGLSQTAIELDEKGLFFLSALAASDLHDKASVLDKFDLFLAANQKKIDRSDSFYENVNLVIKLRNALVHYKASWLDVGSDSSFIRSGSLYESRLWKNLSKKFDITGKFPQPYNDWLSAYCAKFVVDAVIEFNDEVFVQLNSKSFIDHLKSELKVSMIS